MRTLMISVVATFAFSAMPSFANPAGPMSRLPGLEAGIIKVQGRACRACRRDCYGEYRIACGYSDYCRRQFTQCMRACWEDLCR